MVVELLLQTGLRVSELCGLRRGDIQFGQNGQPGLVLVRQGKGKKDRVVPLNSVAEQAKAIIELATPEHAGTG
ncbi:MAG: tyrosine-type recombinase/integrase [Candidatus Methylomirabilia bacterium]